MALPAPLQALFDRLQTYNSDSYNASSNPGGFARGGNQKPVDNFIKSIRDFTAFGRGISDLTTSAADDADRAEQEADAAAAERQAAQNFASNSATSAEQSAASAVESANQAQKLAGTSTTNVTPGTGSRTFTTQAGKYFAVGTFLTIVSTAAPTTRWMAGQVTAYNATTGALTVNVEAIGATTSAAASWSIYLGGARGAQGVQGLPGIATMPYLARSSNTQLVAGDSASLIDATGTFTQTFAAPATLGANWYCFYKNAGTGNITIPASDGVTNWVMYPGEMRLFQCDGTTLRTEVITPFSVAFAASGNFIKPPGYSSFYVYPIGGGAYGGGGGAGFPQTFSAASLATTTAFTVGAGGTSASNNGGLSQFGLIRCEGGTGSNSNGWGGNVLAPSSNPFGWAGGSAPFISSAGRGSSQGDTNSFFGGGAYGGGGTGGASMYGGGGGTSNASANNIGFSAHAGNGGGPGQPGQVPGGGGGSNANGARGEIRVQGIV